jgi:AraC family transcriptional regulator
MRSQQSQQEYLGRINRVIDYIAENIDQPLHLKQLAAVACFSEFHFHRLFRSLMAETVNEFITRLRLEKALMLMRSTPRLSLTGVALESGFQTSANFSRVFKRRLGVSPRRFDLAAYWKDRKIGKEDDYQIPYHLKELPRELTKEFSVSLNRRPEFTVAYIRVFDSYAEGRVLAAFHKLEQWARQRRLLTPEARWIGASKDDPDIVPLNKCSYDVCLTVPRGVSGDGEVVVRRIPASLYAILPCRGDIEKVARAWRFLFQTWLPGSGYQPENRPAMEIFCRTPLEEGGWEEFDLEGWVPVRPL